MQFAFYDSTLSAEANSFGRSHWVDFEIWEKRARKPATQFVLHVEDPLYARLLADAIAQANAEYEAATAFTQPVEHAPYAIAAE